MKNLTNTQGSVWMAILVIIAVVVAALLLSGNYNLSNLFSEDQSIHGLVTEIDQGENYFLLQEIEVLSVAEDGSADVQKTEYVVVWSGDRAIQGYHPSVLDGGEMVRVTLRESLEEDEFLIVDPANIEITHSAEEDVPETTPEPAATTSTTDSE